MTGRPWDYPIRVLEQTSARVPPLEPVRPFRVPIRPADPFPSYRTPIRPFDLPLPPPPTTNADGDLWAHWPDG